MPAIKFLCAVLMLFQVSLHQQIHRRCLFLDFYKLSIKTTFFNNKQSKDYIN